MDFKAGDKVRITNLDNVLFADRYFNEGDESVVKESMAGMAFVKVTKNADAPEISNKDGFDSGCLVFIGEELESLTKIEEEVKLTKLLAVAKRDSEGHEIHEQQEFKQGDVFEILTEPKDLLSMIVFGQLAQEGELDKATIVDFGEGFMVFFEEENEKAYGFGDFFEQIEG